MAKKVAYKKEDIEKVLRALDSVNVKGVANAKYLVFASDLLASEFEEIETAEGE